MEILILVAMLIAYMLGVHLLWKVVDLWGDWYASITTAGFDSATKVTTDNAMIKKLGDS